MKVKTRTLGSNLAHETPQWELGYLDAAEKDARTFLTEEQYVHAVQLVEGGRQGG